jgi:hypothetical protein
MDQPFLRVSLDNLLRGEGYDFLKPQDEHVWAVHL